MTDRVPQHVAIIMDGNGRWARCRGQERLEGHRAGAESVRRVVECCSELGIRFLTLYAFSTENWRRPTAEIKGLMALLRTFLQERTADLHEQRIRMQVIGDLQALPRALQRSLAKTVRETAAYEGGTLILALSYGARTEIVNAARTLARQAQDGAIAPEDIDEELFAQHLYTKNIPDPDLIIRTAGEMRLSNFLLWQASYAELWITETLWPDFSKDEFKQAIADFAARTRRFGGLKDA